MWHIFHLISVGIAQIYLNIIIGSVTLGEYFELKPQSVAIIHTFHVKSDNL